VLLPVFGATLEFSIASDSRLVQQMLRLLQALKSCFPHYIGTRNMSINSTFDAALGWHRMTQSPSTDQQSVTSAADREFELREYRSAISYECRRSRSRIEQVELSTPWPVDQTPRDPVENGTVVAGRNNPFQSRVPTNGDEFHVRFVGASGRGTTRPPANFQWPCLRARTRWDGK